MIMKLKVNDLTEESFAKYGVLIDLKKTKGKTSETSLDYWPLYNVTFGLPHIGILDIRKEKNSSISALERHLINDEVFIPVAGIGVMPFAPPNEPDNIHAKPNTDEIEAFLIDGSKAFVINKGVWHYPPRPISQIMRFVMVVSLDYASDIYKMPIEKINMIV